MGTFWSNLGKNEFSWKSELSQFLNIPIIYHQARNQKKLLTHSWEKCRPDRGRLTDKGDFIGPFPGQESKKREKNNLVIQYHSVLLVIHSLMRILNKQSLLLFCSCSPFFFLSYLFQTIKQVSGNTYIITNYIVILKTTHIKLHWVICLSLREEKCKLLSQLYPWNQPKNKISEWQLIFQSIIHLSLRTCIFRTTKLQSWNFQNFYSLLQC